jgi:hypothetical protein
MMGPMAWRRGKRPKDEAAMPASLPPPGSDELEILPVLQEEGATKDREAYKRLKRAEADLKRMQKREKRAQKKEELRLRAIDRRIAKIERSRRIGPVRLIVNLVVFNGVAAVFAMLLLWWPDRPLYDPVLVTASVHWEVIIICFVGAAGTSIYLLAQNPSPQHVFKAQFVLGVYFALGLISMFSGILLAHVMEGMEALAVDWEYWIWILLYVVAGSASSIAVLHYSTHLGTSRYFLTGTYHRVMGTLTAVMVVSLVLLPFFYLPFEGLMYEVGSSLMWIGWLIMLFPQPAVAASFVVKYQGTKALDATTAV